MICALQTTRIVPIKIFADWSMCVCVCVDCVACAIIKIICFKNCPSQGVHNVICLDIFQQKSHVTQINIEAININIHFHLFELNSDVIIEFVILGIYTFLF